MNSNMKRGVLSGRLTTVGLGLIASITLFTGCARRVIFTTQTSLGLDVSGTAQFPNKVSLSYNRLEGAIVPNRPDGTTHSVYGGLDADVRYFGPHIIRQTFATGDAADLAAERDASARKLLQLKSSNQADDSTNRALVFFTGSTFGLHLAAGEKELAPNLLLGYRRSENAIVPIGKGSNHVRPVYADIMINSADDRNSSSISTNFSSIRGTRIRQSFATGQAANILAAGSPEARANLDRAAGVREAVEKRATTVHADRDFVVDTLYPNGGDNADAAKVEKAFADTAFEDRIPEFKGMKKREFIQLTHRELRDGLRELRNNLERN